MIPDVRRGVLIEDFDQVQFALVGALLQPACYEL